MMTSSLRFLQLTVLAAGMALAVGALSPAVAQVVTQDTTLATKDLPLTPAERRPYLGSYAAPMPDGGRVTFRVFEEGDMLKGQPEGDDALRLLYQGNSVFSPEGMPEFTLTFTIEAGRAAKFVARRPEFTLEAVRIE